MGGVYDVRKYLEHGKVRTVGYIGFGGAQVCRFTYTRFPAIYIGSTAPLSNFSILASSAFMSKCPSLAPVLI